MSGRKKTLQPHSQFERDRKTADMDIEDDIAWLEETLNETNKVRSKTQDASYMRINNRLETFQSRLNNGGKQEDNIETDQINNEIQDNIEINRSHRQSFRGSATTRKSDTVQGLVQKKFSQSKIEITKEGANEIHVKSHPTKDKIEAFEFVQGSTKKLLNYNEDNLEAYEPEKEHSQFAKYTRKSLLFFIFAGVVLQILIGSLKKYGTEKIQVVSTKMNNEFFYDMEDYPLKKLFPLHWFLEINREDVVDRMECVLNNKPEFCQIYDEKKCTVYDIKSELYQDCMLRTQRKFGKDMKQFCINHYEKQGIFSDKEKSKVSFYEQFHGCLQQAGQKKGKRYCDDILGQSTQVVQLTDYFSCYERFKVDIAEYGEQKCRYENPFETDSQVEESSEAVCQDDNSVYDYYGDTCESWYISNPDSCGEYDGGDYNFVAADSCCACGGGTSQTTSGNPYQICLNELNLQDKALKYGCDSKKSTYDQHKYRFMCWPDTRTCTNDDSIGDSYGDTCSSWYDNYSQDCGTYDSEQFQASSLCCACGGGAYSEGDIVYAGLGNTFVPTENCQNDLSIQDAYGDTCTWYDDNADSCGDYDHEGFSASIACCVCGGGALGENGSVELSEGDNQDEFNLEQQSGDCQDDLSTTDSYGDDCTYYITDPGSCGAYDDDDFTASTACCACGGGININTYDPNTNFTQDTSSNITENPPISIDDSDSSIENCQDLDGELGIYDAYDDSCPWYAENPTECGAYDDDDFTASLVCCGCGGGTQSVSLACQDNLNITDSNQNDCTFYTDDPNSCGTYDDDDFTASIFCCACKNNLSNRRMLTESLIDDDYYHDSQDRSCSEYYTDSNRCGGSFDTEKFIATQACVACGGGIIAPLSTYCDETQKIIDERKSCYQSIEQTKNVGYCDSDILTDSAQPTAQSYLECYKGVGINTTDLTLCDNLYPINDKKIGGSFRLLQCYETFGITITKSDMHDKCNQIHKENMFYQIEAYHQCLIDLGSQKTADVCLLDPYFIIISQDERKMFITDFYSYDECLEDSRVQKEAYYCLQKYESDLYFYGYGDKDELRACFEEYKMPLSPVFDCKLKHEPDQERQYQVRTDYDRDLPENCLYFYDGKCQYHYDDAACEELFYYAEYYYDYGQTNQDPHDYMSEQFSNVCEPFVPDFTAQNDCIQIINYNQVNEHLNQKLKSYLEDNGQVGENYVYEEFTNNTVYCDTVFQKQNEVESKYLCYEMVEQPVGPEKCFELPRVVNKELYHYNQFYKYLCLWFDNVELDVEAKDCFDSESLDELHIKKIDDCLKAYESKIMPVVEREGPLYLYLQPPITESDEEDLTRIYDKPTDISAEQIQQFICDSITGLFSSSPYQEILDKRNKQINQINFQMNCEVFQYVNITRDNIVVHFSFNESESFKNQFNKSFYKDDYNSKQVVINRTDSNQQMLNLTFAEDLQLIQVLSNKLFHFKSEINDTKPGLNFTIKDEASYIKFFSDSRSTKILEAYSQIVSQELLPNQNLLGHQTLVSKVNKNVTADILGIPWKLEDLNFISIELQKIHSKIKVIAKDSLVKEEIQRINTFKVNFNIDFVETVVMIHYYTILDVVSELGGLFASYQSILGSIGFIFLISYFYSLSGMIHRKYVHKIDIQQVKQFQTLINSQIIPEIQNKIANSKTGGEQLVKDLETCERLIVEDDFKDTYESTDKRLDEITEIVQTYRPDALADIFEYNKSGQSEWDQIEHLENQEKRKIYLDRVKMPLSLIVKQIQSRMSFYNIYQLIDSIEANKIKIRKIKYTTRLEIKELEALKDTISDQNEKISRQEKRIQVLEEMVKMMNNAKMNEYNKILSHKTN